jgi:hypothetical protein
MNVFGLFPSPVGVDFIDYKGCINFEKIKWKKINDTQEEEIIIKKSKISENYNILEDYLGLKILIEKSINSYIKEILGLDCEFQIVSSWLTKTEKDCDSNFHQHSNSWLSACFYFDSGSSIRFKKQVSTFNDTAVKFYNLYNSLIWDVPIEKNRLLIFPSQIEHKILKNESNKTRYSLALNILPKGNFGNGDSQFNWTTFN